MPTLERKRFYGSQLEKDRRDGNLHLGVKQGYILFVVALVYVLEGLGSQILPFLSIEVFHINVL